MAIARVFVSVNLWCLLHLHSIKYQVMQCIYIFLQMTGKMVESSPHFVPAMKGVRGLFLRSIIRKWFHRKSRTCCRCTFFAHLIASQLKTALDEVGSFISTGAIGRLRYEFGHAGERLEIQDLRGAVQKDYRNLALDHTDRVIIPFIFRIAWPGMFPFFSVKKSKKK